MPSNIYGSITYKGKLYPFFLEGRKVNIVGSAWEYYEDFQNADEEESIFGVTADNRQIVFLKCKYGFSSFHQKVWFCPIGYILSSGNTGEPYDFTYEKVSFSSEALNAFYPPQQAMKTDVDPYNWNGKMTIELKPFEEAVVTFDYNRECICRLDISRYITMKDGKSDIGSIYSAFSFELNTTQQCKELPKYWLALFDFLSFINYGTDIKFEKITLSNRRENGLFERCADVYIFSNKEYQPRSLENTITVRDFPLEKLGSVFLKIASLRGTDNRLDYYFPENYKERFRVDAYRWLVKAMTFEGLFRDCYPDFKQHEKEQFRVAKKVVIDALNAVEQCKMSKRQREYFGDCKKQIERYEGLLEEMLNFVIEKYREPLDDLLSFNRREYNMNHGAYGKIYSDYRNKLAHGDIEQIGEKELAVYRVLQAAIYFLLLEDTELGSNTLRLIAKKLFL